MHPHTTNMYHSPRPSRLLHSATLSLTVALALTLPAQARDLLGADAVLKRLAEPAEPRLNASGPVTELNTRLQTFTRESAGLSPELAATGWLALYDSYTRLPGDAQQGGDSRERLSLGSLIEALPPPAAWDALADAIKSRTANATSARELGLRLLGAVIAGDRETQTHTLDLVRTALAANKKLEDYERENFEENMDLIAEAIAESAGDAARLAAFARTLEKHENPASSSRRGYFGSYLQVPDLVRHAGREAAEPLLRRALRLDVELNVWRSGSTRRALAEIALLEIDHLKRPQWALIASPDDVALYEAFVKKFPASGRDRERGAATGVYLLGLIAAGRTEDATRLVFAEDSQLDAHLVGYANAETLALLQRSGRGEAVVDFLRDMLTRDPALPFWDNFITLAAQQNRAREALDLLRATQARPGLEPDIAASLRQRYATALLAADEVDEGIAVLRALIAEDQGAATKATPSPTPQTASDSITAVNADGDGATDEDDDKDSRDQIGERVERINLLLTLGRLLEKPALIEKGLSAAQSLLPRLGERDYYHRDTLIEATTETLLSQNRAADAEALLSDHLAALRLTERGSYRSETPEALLKLAALYGRAGRPADVLRLFSGSPDLAAGDLAELPVADGSEIADSAHILIADALIATGRAEEARPILRRVVQNQPGCDAAYERLEKLGGPDYEAFLEQAARWDRFEERPLIWKARHQLASGRAAEAEKTIRAAIAIDPSDGEQGKGDRLRAYAVLGDILEKRGDTAQAALMRGAVAAIRLSEEADDWWTAGLLTRAVGLYEESLLKFADAYCIQSRLALRYNELGQFDKAEQHYRRAFELMPESFGRVESHCFGCEGAFKGPRAQTVAEKVFTQLATRLPDRAQVFYLLGYLRSEQDRPAEAAENFRKAVALDPDYLNAWSKLQSLAGATTIPAAERETIALAILRLDPAGKHARPQLDGVADLRKLWGALLAIETSLPIPETGPLFAFTATRAKRDAAPRNEDAYDHFESMNSTDQPLNLRQHLSENSLLSLISRFIESTLNR